MPLPNRPKTFALASCRDVLDKLGWEIDGLREESKGDPEALSYRAFNAAVTAWHLADWVWEDASDEQRAHLGVQSQQEFKAKVLRECRHVALCQQIATASKHAVIDRRPDPHIDAVVSARVGPFPGPFGAGPIGHIDMGWSVKFVDGDNKIDALQVFEMARAYWTEIIYQYGIDGQQ